LVAKLTFDFVSYGDTVQGIEFVPSGFMDGRDEIEGSFSEQVELRNGIAIMIGDVLLPDELCDANEGARNVTRVIL